MEYTKLGNTDIEVSKLCVGCMSFGKAGTMHDWTLDEKQTDEMVAHALDLGINFFDTANGYSAGTSEEYLGKALKNHTTRDKVVIASKVYFNEGRLSQGAIFREIDGTLKRLGTDYLDIYIIHRFDYETPIEETMGALDQIVRSGKALYVGLSNYDGPTLEKATAILDELHVPFIINQNRYSIFDRTIENNGLKAMAARLHKGIITFSPLAQGLLTNRYLQGIPADSRVHTDGRFLKEKDITPEKIAQINALNDIAQARGQTLAEMALAWLLSHDEITTVLIGASKTSQILDNIKAVQNTSFTAEELEAIDRISK